MRLRQGNGGWYRIDGGHGLPGRVYFRLQDVDGQPRMTELYVDGRNEPITAGPLRKFPVAMLEQWAAGMPASDAKRATYGPDLSRLAAHFSTGFGDKIRHWVADSIRAQNPKSGIPQVGMPKESHRDDEEPPAVELSAPDDDGLTDDFLRQVARAYDAAVARRIPPGNALAEVAGVSPRTVHRWVYTARKRGLMPPAASKGRVV